MADGEELNEFLNGLRDLIKPRLDEDDALWEANGTQALQRLKEAGITLGQFGGNCPVQAEGQFDGLAFYFRARGDEWQFHVAPTGDDIFGPKELFYIERDYGEGPYDAGWMPRHEAIGFIVEAVSEFRAQAIEAGTVETKRLDAQHERAVRKDAPNI